MSKGKNLTKRKWRDFRKHRKYEDIDAKKYPRHILKDLDISHISMKKLYGIQEYY
jgi:hypothetical protein